MAPDLQGSTFLSPTVTIADDAITIGESGAPFTITSSSEPTAKGVEYTNWDKHLVEVASTAEVPMPPSDLGRLRVEVMRRLASLLG